jgi:glycosyltransferase involved in cell wall biosynthesis
VCGTGEERVTLEAKIESLGLHSVVKLIGFREETLSLMREADCLVSTAVNEAVGNIFLEALMQDLPIIACDSGGIRDIIEDGHNGLLVKKGHIEGYVLAIHDTLSGVGATQLRVQHGKGTLQEFRFDALAKKMLEQYRALLKLP